MARSSPGRPLPASAQTRSYMSLIFAATNCDIIFVIQILHMSIRKSHEIPLLMIKAIISPRFYIKIYEHLRRPHHAFFRADERALEGFNHWLQLGWHCRPKLFPADPFTVARTPCSHCPRHTISKERSVIGHGKVPASQRALQLARPNGGEPRTRLGNH